MPEEDLFESEPSQAFGLWDDTDEENPVLMLEYDSSNPEFARGFQCGMIWQLLHGGINEFEIPVYVTNAEMVMRMAEVAGYSYTAKYENESEVGEEHDWMLIKFVDTDSQVGTSEA